MFFRDRIDAGQKLALVLSEFAGKADTVVVALPRGGVVVGSEIADVLKLPLDIVVPRKIGFPGNPEFAIGAVAEEGEGIFDHEIIRQFGIPWKYIEEEIDKGRREAKRRLVLFRGENPPLDLREKTVILVDDGIATGATMRAAVLTLRKRGAAQIVVAVPVAASDSLARIEKEADRLVVLYAPDIFHAVGQFYAAFDQTTDEEVIELMRAKTV